MMDGMRCGITTPVISDCSHPLAAAISERRTRKKTQFTLVRSLVFFCTFQFYQNFNKNWLIRVCMMSSPFYIAFPGHQDASAEELIAWTLANGGEGGEIRIENREKRLIDTLNVTRWTKWHTDKWTRGLNGERGSRNGYKKAFQFLWYHQEHQQWKHIISGFYFNSRFAGKYR